MWPFRKKISPEEQEKLINNLFGKFSEGNASMIQDNTLLDDINCKQVDFIFILFNECESSLLRPRFNELFDIILKYDGDIEAVTGTLVSVLFNVPLAQDNSKARRKQLVEELLTKFGADLSIVHGKSQCPYGLVGNEDRMVVTAFIPKYKEILKALSNLEWGQEKEIKSV